MLLFGRGDGPEAGAAAEDARCQSCRHSGSFFHAAVSSAAVRNASLGLGNAIQPACSAGELSPDTYCSGGYF